LLPGWFPLWLVPSRAGVWLAGRWAGRAGVWPRWCLAGWALVSGWLGRPRWCLAGWALDWRAGVWLAHWCLAGALVSGWRAGVWLARWCLAGWSGRAGVWLAGLAALVSGWPRWCLAGLGRAELVAALVSGWPGWQAVG